MQAKTTTLSIRELKEMGLDPAWVPLEAIFDEWEKRPPDPWYVYSYHWVKFRVVDSYHWVMNRPRMISFYLRHGFSQRDLWSLDVPVAKFIYPRLKAFRELYDDPKRIIGYTPEFLEDGSEDPKSYEMWLEKLDKMLYTFKNIIDNEGWELSLDGLKTSEIRNGNPIYEIWKHDNDKHYKKMAEGAELFGKYLGGLWW